jgi:hypothetical protein
MADDNEKQPHWDQGHRSVPTVREHRPATPRNSIPPDGTCPTPTMEPRPIAKAARLVTPRLHAPEAPTAWPIGDSKPSNSAQGHDLYHRRIGVRNRDVRSALTGARATYVAKPSPTAHRRYVSAWRRRRPPEPHTTRTAHLVTPTLAVPPPPLHSVPKSADWCSMAATDLNTFNKLWSVTGTRPLRKQLIRKHLGWLDDKSHSLTLRSLICATGAPSSTNPIVNRTQRRYPPSANSSATISGGGHEEL